MCNARVGHCLSGGLVQEEVGYGGDFVYDKAVGHEIKWKEDKDLTKKIEIKKQRNKSKSQAGHRSSPQKGS
jgi:hypothetical protein